LAFARCKLEVILAVTAARKRAISASSGLTEGALMSGD
jgi:hypothetical protein